MTINFIKKLKLVSGKVENIPGKGENDIFMIHFPLGVFNPFPNKPWFLRVCSTSLLKTLWEKEKLLVMSNFSFTHSVFYPFRITLCHFHEI